MNSLIGLILGFILAFVTMIFSMSIVQFLPELVLNSSLWVIDYRDILGLILGVFIASQEIKFINGKIKEEKNEK